MKLEGPGPWGVRDVSEAIGVPCRTLQRWHERGIARASEQTSGGGARRYHRGDLFRVCAVLTFKRAGIGSKRGAQLLESMRDTLQESMREPISVRVDSVFAHSGDRAL